SVKSEMDEGFAHVDSLVVGPILRAPLLAHHLEDLRKLQQPPPDVQQHLAPLLQGDARRHFHEDDEISLVQLWKELAPEPSGNQSAESKQSQAAASSDEPASEQPGEPLAIEFSQMSEQLRIADLTVARAQQQCAEGGNGCQREDQRSSESEAVGQRQRPE